MGKSSFQSRCLLPNADNGICGGGVGLSKRHSQNFETHILQDNAMFHDDDDDGDDDDDDDDIAEK